MVTNRPRVGGLDAKSRKLWESVEAYLDERGMLLGIDATAIGRFVMAEQVARLARDRIAARAKVDPDSAYTTRGSMGQLVQHPDLKTAREAERDAAAYAMDLLLTPRARKSLTQVEEPEEPDVFAQLEQLAR